MSNVRVNARKPSSIQFIDTARELVVHAMRYAKKFPKSLMFFITKDIVDESRNVYKEVVKANSVRQIKSNKMTIDDARMSYESWRSHLNLDNAYHIQTRMDVLFSKKILNI